MMVSVQSLIRIWQDSFLGICIFTKIELSRFTLLSLSSGLEWLCVISLLRLKRWTVPVMWSWWPKLLS